jgi:hypothetical protein
VKGGERERGIRKEGGSEGGGERKKKRKSAARDKL